MSDRNASPVQCRGCAGECTHCNQVMTDRDDYHDQADELADAISQLTGAEIGEHSSANCPWHNALEAAKGTGTTDQARLLLIVECASQLEVDNAADDDDMAVIEGFDRLRELLRPWRDAREK